MADMRCPKHDIVFPTLTDHRVPGSGAAGNLPAHPINCHPDCPGNQKAQSVPQAAGSKW